MGLVSALEIFQSVMIGLFHDLDYVMVYLDDILIIQKDSETEDGHQQNAEEILKRLKTKCEIMKWSRANSDCRGTKTVKNKMFLIMK